MSVVKITIEHNDGTVWTTSDPVDIRKIGLIMPKHIGWKYGAAAETLRNKYFILLTELAKHLNNGYTKTDLHEQIKPLIMRKFVDFPQYFTTGVPEYSTRNLNRSGWIAMLEQLKVTSNDVFGYIFKD